jgi:hypothetical protein
MKITLECKKCGGSFDTKCSVCGSHVAIEKSLYESDQMLRSRLTGHEVFVAFAPLEKPGIPRPQDHEAQAE